MELNPTIYYILNALALMLPQLVVIIIGIILAVKNRAKNPMVSKLALLGLAVMLLFGILGLALSIIQILSQGSILFYYIAIGIRLVFNVIWAVGLGFLIYAVWTERSEK